MPRATWTWTFDLPPGELWPVLADTNRFNEAMGLPSYVLEETPQSNGTALRRGRGKAAGFQLEWEEKPYEWIHGRYFRQARVFTKGPFRRFGPVFTVEPEEVAAVHDHVVKERLEGTRRPHLVRRPGLARPADVHEPRPAAESRADEEVCVIEDGGLDDARGDGLRRPGVPPTRPRERGDGLRPRRRAQRAGARRRPIRATDPRRAPDAASGP